MRRRSRLDWLDMDGLKRKRTVSEGPEDAEDSATTSNGAVTEESRNLPHVDKGVAVKSESEVNHTENATVKEYKQGKQSYGPNPFLTGICYDVRMRYHSQVVTTPRDYVDPHPEDPRRTYYVYKSLQQAGLTPDNFERLKIENERTLGSVPIPIRPARDDELLLVHTREHIDFINSTELMDRDQLLAEAARGDSIYLSRASSGCARLSCGGAIAACVAVAERRVRNAFAVVRPPGHHAEPQQPGGFCLYSNVAVATQVLLRDFGAVVKRVLIVDWDVHHGNGTQRAFLDDDRVLYVSLHRHDHGKFYPGTSFGSASQVGTGKGAGYSVNVAWSSGGRGDADYIHAFDSVIMPIAQEFSPDFVIVSAGFDAARGDPMGGCLLSPGGYGQLTQRLLSLAEGRLTVVLEGGYNLEATARSALAVTKVLMGQTPSRPDSALASPAAMKDVQDVSAVHAKYWRCLGQQGKMGTVQFKPKNGTAADIVESGKEPSDLVDLALVIREFQRRQSNLVQAEHPLLTPPTNPVVAPVFNAASVLVSPFLYRCDTIIVVVHDMPEVFLAESVVADPASRFVAWATARKHGVVDIAAGGSSVSFEDFVAENWGSLDEYWAAVLCDVYDRYLEFSDCTKLALVGIGGAYGGLLRLVERRPAVLGRCKAVVCFAGTGPLASLNTVVDDRTTDWFYQSSLIFAAADHACWEPGARRPKKRCGRVLKADSMGLLGSVRERFEEVMEFVDECFEEE